MKELAERKDIIRQLQKKILALEGFGNESQGQQIDVGLGFMNAAFPGGAFPTGAIHEFISPTEACFAAANGFISGLLGTLLKKGGICLWISAGRKLFPPALKFFGMEPHRIIFIDVKREKDALWVAEQGLKCNAVSAVVAELREVNFAESRRLQLAVEESRVTGFLHRHHPRMDGVLGCVSKWKVRPLASHLPDNLPGVGFPRWEVELEKIRNGRPGIWQVEWRGEKFRLVPDQKQVASETEISKRERYA